jgi:molecular chaperone Hsp33
MRACAPPAALHARRLLRGARTLARSGPARRSLAVAAAVQQDSMLRTLSGNAEVAALVCCATQLVGHAAGLHRTAPTATAALGRGLVGGLLLTGFREPGEAVQLTFRGSGELGRLSVIASSAGEVKGTVDNPDADPPLRADGKLAVGDCVGAGVLTVVRTHPYMDPQTSTVALTTSEIAEDLAAYLRDSEQVASALALGVSLSRDLQVVAAGGYWVQCLPFASEATLAQLERNISALPSMTDMLSSGETTESITALLLNGLGVEPGATSVPVSYGPCDPEELRVRMERACATLGKAELERIVSQEGRLARPSLARGLRWLAPGLSRVLCLCRR